MEYAVGRYRSIDDDLETATLMPLYWTIDSKARLFTAVAEGEVSLADATRMLEAMAGAKALSYSKLFDGRAGVSTMRIDELLTLCARIRSYHVHGTMGPLAIVATPDQTWLFARLLGALASARRPMKVFESPRQARNWINQFSSQAAAT
jgi:hypothetical protein